MFDEVQVLQDPAQEGARDDIAKSAQALKQGTRIMNGFKTALLIGTTFVLALVGFTGTGMAREQISGVEMKAGSPLPPSGIHSVDDVKILDSGGHEYEFVAAGRLDIPLEQIASVIYCRAEKFQSERSYDGFIITKTFHALYENNKPKHNLNFIMKMYKGAPPAGAQHNDWCTRQPSPGEVRIDRTIVIRKNY
ncbi:MAG: hypothetical protein Q8J92_02705 [Parvibaculum sp.]|nr:hypothetical protein [Parvibaculum sp.]